MLPPVAPPPLITQRVAPPGLVAHRYTREVVLPHPRGQVWHRLNRPSTFVDAQVWPFRVEFVPAQPGGSADFHEGVLNVHHGPAFLFAGRVGEVVQGRYRDLQYHYGSYALSLRLLRPTRLQLWFSDVPGSGTHLRLQLDSFARPWLAQPWTLAQRLFWAGFLRQLDRALRHETA